ncbi:hypothetical protein D3C81_1882040 [compost metagenome]
MTVMRPETRGSSTTVVPRMPEISSTMSRSSALFIASCHFSCAADSAPAKVAVAIAARSSAQRKAGAPVKLFMI